MKMKKKFEHWEVVTLIVMIYDFLAVTVSYFAALWVRFDCRFSKIEIHFLQAYYKTILIYSCFCIIVFWFMRLYKSIWRFASYSELLRVILATAVTGLIHIVFMTFFVARMPISYFLFGILIQFSLTLGIRFSYRFVLLLRGRGNPGNEYKKRVMLLVQEVRGR